MIQYIITKEEYEMYKPILKHKKDKYALTDSRLRKDIPEDKLSDYELDEDATALRIEELTNQFLGKFGRRFEAFTAVASTIKTVAHAIAESPLFNLCFYRAENGLHFWLEEKTTNYGMNNFKGMQRRYAPLYEQAIKEALLDCVEPIYLLDGTAIYKTDASAD